MFTKADQEALFEEVLLHGWMYQDEMVYWLHAERGVLVHRSTISRFLKASNLTRKTLQLISVRRDEQLRDDYRQTISRYSAEELVFIDESIFKEKDGWRCRGYGPIGSGNRWIEEAQRGTTWSILPAYTIDRGYLDCTAIQEDYFNTEAILERLELQLLPTLDREFGGRTMCVVLDNCSTHCDPRIEALIRRAGHTMQFLPPYSPDFNPIELTFSVLKAWLKRHFYFVRDTFNTFGELLGFAVRESRCNRFSKQHFRRAGGGGLYVEESELLEAQEAIRQYERGALELVLS